jgi:hypothetical protein
MKILRTSSAGFDGLLQVSPKRSLLLGTVLAGAYLMALTDLPLLALPSALKLAVASTAMLPCGIAKGTS